MVFSRWVRLRTSASRVTPSGALSAAWFEPVGPGAAPAMRLAGQGALDDDPAQAVDNGGDADNHADARGHPAQNQRGLKPPFAQ